VFFAAFAFALSLSFDRTSGRSTASLKFFLLGHVFSNASALTLQLRSSCRLGAGLQFVPIKPTGFSALSLLAREIARLSLCW
jgi:hypothetical protein